MDNGSKVFNQARIRHILPLCPQYTQRWSPFRFSNHRLPKATPTIKLKTRPDKVWLRPLCPQRTRLRSAITPLFDSDICQFYVPPSLLLLTSSNIQEDPALLLQCPSAAYTDKGRRNLGGRRITSVLLDLSRLEGPSKGNHYSLKGLGLLIAPHHIFWLSDGPGELMCSS